LAAYIEHLDLVLLSGEDEAPGAPEIEGDAISVMTIHQAKGLEFDAVFVPALVEGRLPQSGRSQRFELPPAVLEPLVRGREDVIAHDVLRRAEEARRAGEQVTAGRLKSWHASAWQATSFPDERRAPTFKRNGLAQLEAFRAAGGFDSPPELVERDFTAPVDGF